MDFQCSAFNQWEIGENIVSHLGNAVLMKVTDAMNVTEMKKEGNKIICQEAVAFATSFHEFHACEINRTTKARNIALLTDDDKLRVDRNNIQTAI